jgi:hypothetical protein
MDRKSLLQTFRKLHKWPGVIITLFAIHFAISGIFMNHRSLLSGFDLSRKWLPKSYQYNNWNQAAVRGGFNIGKDSLLIFGNIGAWIKENDHFIDYNKGLPHGIDNRKINQALQFKGQVVIATQFGLYKRHLIDESWSLAPTGLNDQRLVDLFIKQDTLIILTRDQLVKSADLKTFEIKNLPAPEGYRKSAGLFNTLWELHSGELFGTIGKLLVDLLGVVTIALAVTGLIHFFLPTLIRNRKRETGNSGKLPATFKLNLRWHNVVGYVFAIFLIINTTAGIFLRPPLLIPILNKKVGIIPGSHLDTNNPWHDKLRKGAWNQQLGIYIFSTSNGFYAADETLLSPMIPSYSQPPVSLMGCNVFEPLDATTYLVGSFSGLYTWNPATGRSFDFFTNKIYQEPTGMAMPVSDHMVAGYIRDFNNNWVFDYNHGLSEKSGAKSWPMPEVIKQNSPISSWNFALEIHTGRVLEPFIGIFYLLYIPLAGLSVLMVLISGFMIWLLPARRAQIR